MSQRRFQHINYEQRLRIQKLWNEGHSKTEISQLLGFNYSSIDRELKRGSVNGKYNADYSQNLYRQNLSIKGPAAIISSAPELGEYIAKLILEERLSLSQIVERLDYEGSFKDYPKSRSTLYSAIDNGLIPGVNRDSLKSDETTVFNNGTIHLAKWVRQELLIEDGDILRFEVVDGKIVFTKESNEREG